MKSVHDLSLRDCAKLSMRSLSRSMTYCVDELRERKDGSLYSLHGHNATTYDALVRRGLLQRIEAGRLRMTDLGREVQKLIAEGYEP